MLNVLACVLNNADTPVVSLLGMDGPGFSGMNRLGGGMIIFFSLRLLFLRSLSASVQLSLILLHYAFKCVAGLPQEWVVVVVEASGAWIIWATWDMA